MLLEERLDRLTRHRADVCDRFERRILNLKQMVEQDPDVHGPLLERLLHRYQVYFSKTELEVLALKRRLHDKLNPKPKRATLKRRDPVTGKYR